MSKTSQLFPGMAGALKETAVTTIMLVLEDLKLAEKAVYPF